MASVLGMKLKPIRGVTPETELPLDRMDGFCVIGEIGTGNYGTLRDDDMHVALPEIEPDEELPF